MKTLLILVLFSVSVRFNSFGQKKYPLFKFKMHSEIWTAKVDSYNSNLVSLSPKTGSSFGYDETYLLKIDEKKIQSYLSNSFNAFRKSYDLPPAKIDRSLTKLCIEDAKEIDQNKGIFKNHDSKSKQVWDKIPVFCFGNVDIKTMDINKVIADSFFDYFVGNDNGMDVLLDKSDMKYGFGIHYNKKDYGFYLVMKSKS